VTDTEQRDADRWDAERVRALRDWLDASQATLAEQIGTRQQTVSEWETGSSQPRRMSRRLLHFVAEESGFYSTDRPPSADERDDS
jgi:DNA-binding transcriptional regulator YiaG